MTTLMATRNMSKSTIKAPPTRASIEGMFGYSTVVFDDILDLLPPALPCVEDGGNTLGETILIQPLRESQRERGETARSVLTQELFERFAVRSHVLVVCGRRTYRTIQD